MYIRDKKEVKRKRKRWRVNEKMSIAAVIEAATVKIP